MSLLLRDEAPNLVNLEPSAREVPHPLVQEPLAALANLSQKAHDRVAMRPCHTLRRADRVALDKSADDLDAAGGSWNLSKFVMAQYAIKMAPRQI